MADHNARRIFASLVAAAYVDGLLTDDERLVLHRKATELGIPIREMNEMLAQGERGQISLGFPTSNEDRDKLLESMIEVVCADGRIEAPEHHLLAKVASHLKIELPELRQRIKNRMDQRSGGATKKTAAPRPARPASPPPAPPPMAPPMTPAPPSGTITGATAPPAPSSAPMLPPGPLRLDAPRLVDPVVADVPPVTLQLIKQHLSFDSEEETRRYIERTLSVPKEEAARILQAVLQAFPDLRPQSRVTSWRPQR